MRRDLALTEFRQLEPDKQRLCRAAIVPFVELQKRLKRDACPNFHLWIRQRRFEEFPGAGLRIRRRAALGRRRRARRPAARRAHGAARPVRLVDDPERGRGLWSTKPQQPDLVGAGQVCRRGSATWQQVDLGSAQYAAWRDRLALWLGVEIEAGAGLARAVRSAGAWPAGAASEFPITKIKNGAARAGAVAAASRRQLVDRGGE
jgi:hypothetical protein